MNRCLTPLMLVLALAGTAHAQTRSRDFPKEALRGEMTVKQPPYIEMDDRVTRLSPGARVFDEGNRVMRPSGLVNRELTVNYMLDRRGQVTHAWILTADEAKEKRPGYGVQRNFTFESQQTSDNTQGQPAEPAKAN
jgi:hypothetical protein